MSTLLLCVPHALIHPFSSVSLPLFMLLLPLCYPMRTFFLCFIPSTHTLSLHFSSPSLLLTLILTLIFTRIPCFSSEVSSKVKIKACSSIMMALQGGDKHFRQQETGGRRWYLEVPLKFALFLSLVSLVFSSFWSPVTELHRAYSILMLCLPYAFPQAMELSNHGLRPLIP